jgi:hypothetical protein
MDRVQVLEWGGTHPPDAPNPHARPLRDRTPCVFDRLAQPLDEWFGGCGSGRHPGPDGVECIAGGPRHAIDRPASLPVKGRFGRLIPLATIVIRHRTGECAPSGPSSRLERGGALAGAE